MKDLLARRMAGDMAPLCVLVLRTFRMREGKGLVDFSLHSFFLVICMERKLGLVLHLLLYMSEKEFFFAFFLQKEGLNK